MMYTELEYVKILSRENDSKVSPSETDTSSFDFDNLGYEKAPARYDVLGPDAGFSVSLPLERCLVVSFASLFIRFLSRLTNETKASTNRLFRRNGGRVVAESWILELLCVEPCFKSHSSQNNVNLCTEPSSSPMFTARRFRWHRLHCANDNNSFSESRCSPPGER